MDKKYIYAQENISRLILVAAIISIPMVAIIVFALKSNISAVEIVGYAFLFALLIVYIILLVFFLRALKCRKHHRTIENLGIRTNGVVVAFGYEHHDADLHTDPASPASESHWLKIKYTDINGCEKIFETPTLSFRPDKKDRITCDIYLYNNEILATNFENLSKKKTNWFDVLVYLIIGAVILGIAFIVNWFRK